MKQTTRLLALSALVLAVVLAAIGTPALNAPSVAFAQQVPVAPVLTAQRSGANTINLSWEAVDGAERYELYAHDGSSWSQLDGGETDPLTATSFAHENLEDDQLYFYQILAVNAAGAKGALSVRINEVAGPNAPARPVLSTTAGYQSIRVEWDAVPNAASYVLYRWDQSWAQVGGDISDNFYEHTGLTAGQTYYYQARAKSSGNVLSALSLIVEDTVLRSPTISAPTSFSAARGDQEITLTWGAPSNTAGDTIARYEYRYIASGGTLPPTWTGVGTAVTETVTGLTNGTTYDFEIRAIGDSGAVSHPASTSGTPSTVPGSPTLSASATHNSVTLTWTEPSDNGGDAITAYLIQRANDDGTWTDRATRPRSATTSWTDSGLTRSTEYTYRIFARNDAGDSDWTSATIVTLAQAPVVPSAPTASSLTPGPGEVTLGWEAPAFNGGSAINEYSYRYRETNSRTWRGWFSVGTETKVTIDNLKPLNLHDFEVRARNSAGYGAVLELDGTPLATMPTSAPTTLEGEVSDAGDDGVEINVVLTWTPLTAADTTLNGGSTITGYEVEWKTSDGDDDDWEPVTGNLNQDDVTITHTDVSPGTTYQYRIRATNTVTDGDPTWSNVVSVEVDPNAPGAPADPTLAPDVNSITISWAAPMVGTPAVVDDGGSSITSYEIWVGVDSVTGADNIAALTATIKNLTPTRTEYTHTGLKSQETYYYRVRAVNGASRDDGIGPWSPEVSEDTTQATAGTPDAPTGLNAAEPTATGTVAVTWTAPTGVGTLPLTGFELQYQRDDDQDDDDWTDSTTVTISSPETVSYNHENVEGGAGIMWEYRVRAVNGHGAGPWTDSDPIEVPARAPSSPVLTATAASSTEIVLQWTKPVANGTEITGYVVQQWGGSTWGSDLLNEIADTEFEEDSADTTALTVTEGISGGTEYFFRVRAESSEDGLWSGNTPDDSTTGAASVTTPAGVPGAPGLAITDSVDADDVGTVRLTLTLAAGGGSDVTRYELQIWYDGRWNTGDDLDDTTDAQVIDGLTPGVKYYFATRAWNSAGFGPWSSPVVNTVAKTGAPDTPDLDAEALDGTSIMLTWTAPEANGTTITGYEIQQWNGTNAWEPDNLLAMTIPLLTSFTVEDLNSGVEYFFRIRAVAATNSDWSAADDSTTDAASAKTLGDTPDAVDAPTVTPSGTDGDVSVTWTKLTGADTGGSAITEYDIQIWDSANQRWLDEASEAADTGTDATQTYTDNGLPGGSTQYYRVRAHNSEGPGPWSAYASNSTPVPPRVPDTPVLTATTTGTNSVRLTWPMPNANGTAPGTFDGYVLTRWNSHLETPAWSGNIAISGADTTLYLDTGDDDGSGSIGGDEVRLAPGTTYFYRIRSNGAPDNAWSTVVQTTTVQDAPDRPQEFTATADGDEDIDLSWSAPATDGGNDIIHYRIEIWNSSASSWDLVTTVPATRTAYTHSNRAAGTRYVYRVRAQNRAPTNGGVGPWSTVASATTDAAE